MVTYGCSQLELGFSETENWNFSMSSDFDRREVCTLARKILFMFSVTKAIFKNEFVKERQLLKIFWFELLRQEELLFSNVLSESPPPFQAVN